MCTAVCGVGAASLYLGYSRTDSESPSQLLTMSPGDLPYSLLTFRPDIIERQVICVMFGVRPLRLG